MKEKFSKEEKANHLVDAVLAAKNQLNQSILNRQKYNLIKEIRGTGARIQLIGDGDVSAAVACSMEGTGIDMLLGVGGAPEGVISGYPKEKQVWLKPGDKLETRIEKLGNLKFSLA